MKIYGFELSIAGGSLFITQPDPMLDDQPTIQLSLDQIDDFMEKVSRIRDEAITANPASQEHANGHKAHQPR